MSEKEGPNAGPSNRRNDEGADELELVDQFLAEAEEGSLRTSQESIQDEIANGTNGSYSTYKVTAKDASSSTKGRAVVLFLVVNCAYDLLLHRLSVRNPSSLVLFLPGQALVVLIAVVLIRLLGASGRVQNLSAHLGDNFTLLPSTTWLQYGLLAVFTFVFAVTYVYQAFWTDHFVGQSILTYAAPILLLAAQYLGKEMPGSIDLSAACCIVLVPAFLTISLLDITTIRSGAFTVAVLAFSEAFRWIWARTPLQNNMTELGVIAACSPIIALLQLTTVLPIAGFGGAFKHLDRYSAAYFLVFIMLTTARDWSALNALRIMQSLPAFGLVIIAKCCSTLLLEWYSSNLEVCVIAFITLSVLATTVAEIRAFNFGFRNKYLSLDSDAEADTDTISVSTASKSFKRTLLISFVPLLAWLARSCFSSSSLTTWIPQQQSLVEGRTLDVVISYYNEPMEGFHQLKNEISSRLQNRNVDINWILYLKNNETAIETLQRDTGVQKMIRLPNTGREGGTYLKHILLNYNATVDPSMRTDIYRGLADKTLFVQPHLAWDWIARQRIDSYRDNTGFMALGPYITMDCSHDMLGNGDFDRYPQIYALFRDTFCPPTHQLASYAAQFFVSRKRIVANSYSKYQGWDDIFEAPEGHWIYGEGTWWKYHGEPGPTNPYLGHMLERFWTVMFGCEDPAIAEACQGPTEGDPDKCQCFD